MKKLVNDKEVLEGKGREEFPIPEADIEVRDKIVDDLFKAMKDDDISLRIISMWEDYQSDRSDWYDRQDTFLSDWDEFIDVKPQGAFESSSNLHIPMPLWVLRTYHARMMQAIISPEPSVSIRARKSGYVNKAPLVESTVKYTLVDWANHYEGIEETIDQWIWSWLSTGIGYMKWRWDKVYTTYKGVETVHEEALPKAIINPQDGKEYLVPDIKEVLKEKLFKDKKFDGPVLEFIPAEDVAVIGPDITDTRNADAVIHRQWLTADELWTLADRGIVNKDTVESMIDGGGDPKSSTTGTNIKNSRTQNAGEGSTDKQGELTRYEILEAYVKYDVEGNGINSDVIVWVASKQKKLLRATYLQRQNVAGERPITNAIFHKRSGQNSGMPVGLAEMLHPISRELDAMHNMRVDFGLISTVPFGFYRSGSSVNPDIYTLEPGKMYPIDQPGDVYFPTISNRTVFGFQEEEALYKMVERLTGISDLALGVLSSTQGITRTAAGTNQLVGEMNVNLDLPLQRLNRGWKKTLKYLVHMLQQRLPRDMEMRLNGDDGISQYIKLNGPEDIAGDYDIEISPSSAASNKNIQMSQAQQILQLIQNPLLLQIGIVTPENIYEAVKNYLKVIGIKSVSRFINSKFENSVVLSPKEEFERVIAGDKVTVMPNSDHEGFVAYAQSFMQDDELAGKFNKNQFALIAGQVKIHEQMIQAMKQMQAQQNNSNQVFANQQMSNNQPEMQGQIPTNVQGDLPV